jgi:hypothetical protein
MSKLNIKRELILRLNEAFIDHWLQIQRSRVRYPALPDFLRSSGFGMGSIQPREDIEELL